MKIQAPEIQCAVNLGFNVFKSENIIRMHDTDMSGHLYFPSQFRLIHDAYDDLLHAEGVSVEKLFHKIGYIFVIVHCETDFLLPLNVGDPICVHAGVENIGNTSFTLTYKIFRKKDTLVGLGKTIFVGLDNLSRKKCPIHPFFRSILDKYLINS